MQKKIGTFYRFLPRETSARCGATFSAPIHIALVWGNAMIKHLLSRENVCIRTSAMGGEVSFPLSTVKNRGCGSSSGMVIRSSMCPFPVILVQLFKNIKKHSYEVSRRCSKGIEQIEKYLFN